jgi:cation transport ATPase
MFCEIVLSDWRQKMSGERSFILENLSCPHCAASIEKKAVDINGVTAANVALVMKKLTLY